MSRMIVGENLKKLEDNRLVELLFDMEDRLPRSVADEFVARGDRMIDYLWDIIKSQGNWDGDDERFWAVIHATFILGAIGVREAVTPLIMSLRFSDAHDCDWIFEALPSMFGRIGPVALEPLKQIALDRSNRWFTRIKALDGMAAVTIHHAKCANEVFDFIASFMKDYSEEMEIRGLAGSILLDFKLAKYKKSLLELAEDEDNDFFSSQNVLEIESPTTEKELSSYDNDWLKFYDEEEISARQLRWKREKREGAWWGRPWRWWSEKVQKRIGRNRKLRRI